MVPTAQVGIRQLRCLHHIHTPVVDRKSLAVVEAYTHIFMVRHTMVDHTDLVEVERHRDPVKGEYHTGFVVAGILHTGFAEGEHRKGLAEGERHMALVVCHTQSMGPDWSSGTFYFSLLVNY